MADSSHSSLLAGLETGDIKVRNSRGSSAGAGSGDCHHYLQGRRAEMFRLQSLQEKSEKEKKDKEWEEMMKARIAEAESKKAKKSEKRHKQKQKRKAAQLEAHISKKTKTDEIISNEEHKFSEDLTKEEQKEEQKEEKSEPTAETKPTEEEDSQ